jgi:signal transduction histidine kinase
MIPTHAPVHFLLADDLEENLLSLEALLRRDGLLFLKARSGEEALEHLLRYEVALALLDVQMPGMDGFELAELMRGNERTRRVPIIFLTAGSSDGQRRFRGYEAGAVDFIHKPIEPDVLRSKAEVFFELCRQRQQISAQRDELRSYAEALVEADRRKDEFLATLAHELRNPLASINNGLQILRKSPHSGDADSVREVMDRQMVHLIRLVDDLLDVSRVSHGKIELRREKVDIRTILQSAKEASQLHIDSGGHTLTVEMPAQAIWIDADPTRMVQIVSNLLNNAAKYTPEGGQIHLSGRDEQTEAVIVVSDKGLGIPAEMLPEVFQLFTQIDCTLDRAQGGLGIGLALVKQLVELHGGAINAESEGIGKGSRFEVRMPAVAGVMEEPVAPATRQESPAEVQVLRILVVDDNFDVAQTIGWMLESIGHDYHLVHDGREALAAAKEFRPDAILLDIGLPGMDGFEVCRALRQEALFKDTLIIAQSGWGQERNRTAAAGAGFNHHLVKPVSLDRLEALLSQVTVDSQ